MRKYLILATIVLVVIVSGCQQQETKDQKVIQEQKGNLPPGGVPGFGDGKGGMPGKIDGGTDKNKISNMGELKQRNLDGGNIKMLVPDGWDTQVFPGCTGLVTIDGKNVARSVIFLNGLHQSGDPLPPGITPEDYVRTYMQNDFKTMSDVSIIKYEDIDLNLLRSGGANVQAMRISFKNNGVPAIGSFTVNTYGTSLSSAVGYVWGITSTANEFDADGEKLLTMINSIKYDNKVLEECRKAQKESWGIKE